MADPITIIGTAASVISIIELVSNTIKGVRDLKNEWGDADLTFSTLTTQLTALRAALGEISEWTATEDVGLHHQLIMDLDESMACCRLLIGKIEGHLEGLHRGPDEALDFQSKFKLVFKGKSIEDLQRLINHQTTALSLLLTACNCKTASDQKILLEKSSTRKVMSKVKAESASMIVHRDSASFFSSMTDNLSKLSVVFGFDQELFSSSVYMKALRGSLKERLRRQQQERPDGEVIRVPGAPLKLSSSELSQRLAKSQIIDTEITREKAKLRSECKILVVGGPGSGKEKILQRFKELQGIFDSGEEKDRAAAAANTGLGLREIRLNEGNLDLRLLDVGSLRTERRRLMPMFENVLMIFFVADLAGYNQTLDEDPEANSLRETITLFESVVNSRWFDRKRTSVLLLLNNYDKFRERLPSSPLKDFFPEYTRDTGEESGSNEEMEYILDRFKEANVSGLQLYSHLASSLDYGLYRYFVGAVRQSILDQNLWASGLLDNLENSS